MPQKRSCPVREAEARGAARRVDEEAGGVGALPDRRPERGGVHDERAGAPGPGAEGRGHVREPLGERADERGGRGREARRGVRRGARQERRVDAVGRVVDARGGGAGARARDDRVVLREHHGLGDLVHDVLLGGAGGEPQVLLADVVDLGEGAERRGVRAVGLVHGSAWSRPSR